MSLPSISLPSITAPRAIGRACRRQYKRYCPLCRTLLLVLLPIGLVGCRSQSPTVRHTDGFMHPVQSLDYKNDPLLQNRPLPQQYVVPHVRFDATSNVELPAAEHIDVANAQAMNYYTTICDVYWKLNWMRKELLHG